SSRFSALRSGAPTPHADCADHSKRFQERPGGSASVMPVRPNTTPLLSSELRYYFQKHHRVKRFRSILNGLRGQLAAQQAEKARHEPPFVSPAAQVSASAPDAKVPDRSPSGRDCFCFGAALPLSTDARARRS